MHRHFFVPAAALAALTLTGAVHAQIRGTVIANGLTTPVQYVVDPTNSSRAFAVQQNGVIVTLINGVPSGNLLTIPSGQISVGGEQGLLGMALAPDYAGTGNFYLNFTDQNGDTQIARYTNVGGVADAGSRFNILRVDQPDTNHNGGTIRFGVDGMLTIGMGDGGGSFDPGNNAQSASTLLGKFLRIDPSADQFPGDPDRNYSIPSSNPFFGSDPFNALDEIWSIGWRNPFKWSFDSFGPDATNALIVGDVGQNAWEEIDYERQNQSGRNYGWVVREGAHDTGHGSALFGPLVDPIGEYDHGIGSTVIGGVVYRGSALGPDFEGRYFYADFITDKLWSADILEGINGGDPTLENVLDHSAEVSGLANPVSIDIGLDGEVFVTEYGGRVVRLDPVPEPSSLLVLAGLAAIAVSRRK